MPLVWWKLWMPVLLEPARRKNAVTIGIRSGIMLMMTPRSAQATKIETVLSPSMPTQSMANHAEKIGWTRHQTTDVSQDETRKEVA